MFNSNDRVSPLSHLSLVKSSQNSSISCQEKRVESRKKRAFEGFSADDIATTKKIQRLYYDNFSVNRIPQDEVASRVGWSQSTLNLYINGKQRIGDTALRKFCNLFDVTPDVLSVNYKSKDAEDSGGKSTDMSEMKAILAELIEAVDGKRDLNLIVMRAKNIVNE